MKKNILITGRPGSGKTTAIEKILGSLSGIRWSGFFTREIRTRAGREGFEIVTSGGGRGVLARVDGVEGPRVGKYRVNLADVEGVALPSIVPGEDTHLIVIDEIGTMEMRSDAFRRALRAALDGPHPLLAAIKEKGDGEIEAIKAREDSLVYRLTEADREETVERCLAALRSVLSRTNGP